MARRCTSEFKLNSSLMLIHSSSRSSIVARRFAVRSVPQVIENALENAGLKKEDVDFLVMHQANQRILDAAAERLGLTSDRVVSNLSEYGNTSAASIPLALDGAVRSGTIKKGDVLAMAGFGAGLTWASVIVKWG
jgi:3-oxoacyl-[acyl-carrier-protein] synthase-3